MTVIIPSFIRRIQAGVGLLLLAYSTLGAWGATLTFTGAQTNQYIDGFGVNANYYDWNTNDLGPVLTALQD